MRKFLGGISIIGVIVLLFVALETTPNPHEWIDSITGVSFGYPRYIITWGGYCMLYLGGIWGIYYVIYKIIEIINRYKIKKMNRGNIAR